MLRMIPAHSLTQVDNVSYNRYVDNGVVIAQLPTDKVATYHWENMLSFKPDNLFHTPQASCSPDWIDINTLPSSDCASFSIYSIYRRNRAQAINNIAFTMIVLVIMLVGLGLLAADFNALLGEPIKTVISLVGRLQKVAPTHCTLCDTLDTGNLTGCRPVELFCREIKSSRRASGRSHGA